MNPVILNIQKKIREWKNDPSLKDIDVSQLSKEERAELSNKLDKLEALALKAKKMVEK